MLALLAQSKLSVVSLVAPPGYGKTTLLSQWAATHDGTVVWLTVDALDNDATVLVSYLGAAINRVSPVASETAKALSGGSSKILASAVPRLVSELDGLRNATLVIIDDVHRLTNRAALDALSAVIDHLPGHCRIALAGRYQAQLPFARLMADRHLLELGTGELALDTTEAAALVDSAGYPLNEDEIEALTRRTEGWAVGIYLATQALRRGKGPVNSIASFNGADDHVVGYLRSEFEQGLEPDDMTFLTRSSVLEHVSAGACEAVTGLPGSAERLRRLTEQTLLVHELAAEEPTFRYHNLLREFLALELEIREPGQTKRMHRRASAWYQSAGDTDLAIEHALAADDLDAAAQYITAAAYAMHQRGKTATLERWLSAFDGMTMASHPQLAVIAAWVFLLTGRADEADAMADVAEHATYHGSPGDGSASFASQRAMLRAAMTRSGPGDALASAKIAVALERPGSPWRATALLLAGSAYEMLGESGAADLAYTEAIGTGAGSSWATVMSSFAKRAQLRIDAGDWAGAEEFIERAEELREVWGFDGFVNLLLVHAISARIAIQRGDFERGRESLVQAQLLRPLANHASPWMSVDGLLNVSRAYLAMSDPAGAQLAIREAEAIVRRRPSLGSLTSQLVEVRERLADATATLIGSSALTSAELRVLPFLPTYLSFQEIGERLMISRNTVKTHAMSIYGKLWASSRGEAVERAVEIGLLEPYPALTRTSMPEKGSVARHLRLLRPDEMDEMDEMARGD